MILDSSVPSYIGIFWHDVIYEAQCLARQYGRRYKVTKAGPMLWVAKPQHDAKIGKAP